MRLSSGIAGHSALLDISPVSVPAEAGLFAFWNNHLTVILTCQEQKRII